MKKSIYIQYKKKLLIKIYFYFTSKIKKIKKPNKKELYYIEKLKKEIKKFEYLDNKKNTSAWENYRKRLREDILKKDPRNFTNWKIIRETMFCIPSTQEYKSLMNSKNRTLWKEVIEESKIGNPKPYYLMKKSSGNIIHQAYHIQQLNNYSDINLSKINTIVEIGGGYGSMCRLIHRLGFKGTYIIFDLPEFLELQKFYLRLNNIPKEKIFYFSDYKKIKKITNSKQIDLFIGLWSFSECPLELRSEILEYLKKSDYVLLAYQDIFRNINNIKYFKELKKYFNNYDWYNQEISHIKNNYYLIGKNKKNN